MTRDETAAFIRRYVDAWERNQIPTLLECYTEQAQVSSPMFHTITGKPQLEKSFHDLFHAFTDWKLTIDEIIVEGDRAVMVFTAHATHRGEVFGVSPSGRRFENRGVFVYTFDGRCIVKEIRVYDFTGMLIQVGVLKAKAM